ncbi:hypothetical protein LOC68_25550 [Blastopirellula sp. JC732]|uniref:Uncharacterized protein n=1 Tax=Blastopirellula sediminis TaxID=2894196 RepID=A0A9X1MRZ4_9BACT|nr:hypothetical protein [Blastopirellula sediminis]MCC9604924.1 hypothetical protein [Blastopirellula sediminis]MCC9631776.1 hypothetical protein [Blastopirellula sediminis]
MRTTLGAFVLSLTMVAGLHAADAEMYGLKKGTPEIKSAGPLAFAPDGVLLVGDPKSAAVFAIATGEKPGAPEKVKFEIASLREKLAKVLGGSPADLNIADLAVNPETGTVYLSVASGGKPALVKIDADQNITSIALKDVPFAQVELSDAPADELSGEGRRRRNLRNESITDIAYADGQVIVTGLAAGEGASAVRSVPFPFTTGDQLSRIEIFHAAHGRDEDTAVVRTFVPFNIGGEPHVLAGFTCTPLVKFPVKQLQTQEKVKGTTVAELGNRNQPLDMIVYEKDGKTFLLSANSARGVMKISTDDLEREEGLTEPVKGGGTAGQSYETIGDLEGVVQLAKLNDTSAVVVIQGADNGWTLKSVPLP